MQPRLSWQAAAKAFRTSQCKLVDGAPAALPNNDPGMQIKYLSHMLLATNGTWTKTHPRDSYPRPTTAPESSTFALQLAHIVTMWRRDACKPKTSLLPAVIGTVASPN
eukprot:7059295-Lingulodinium_polyedra.AAC.1